VPSVHLVSHVPRELGEEGLERDLLEHVWHRLEDQTLLDREDLRESVGQLLQGDVVVLRAPAKASIARSAGSVEERHGSCNG
jgi:hypothetical protein